MTRLPHQLLTLLAEASSARSVADLAAQVARDSHTVVKALLVLHRRGLIDRVALGVYRLAAAGQALLEAGRTVGLGPSAGRSPRVLPQTLRHRVWTLLGTRQKVSLPELLRLASTGEEREAHGNIRHYLRLLERTGYLLRLQPRKSGTSPQSNGHAQWLVLHWTGPRPPVSRQNLCVAWDPNLQRDITETKGWAVLEGAP